MQGSPTQTRVVEVDGQEVTERRCSRCEEWKRQTIEHFGPRQRDRRTRRVIRWDAYCRPCRNAYQRERWALLDAEAKAAALRERAARIAGDPERAELHRRLKRESARRRRDDPDGRERRRAAARSWYRRMKRDRARYEAYLERSRMNYRLRQERAGRPLDSLSESHSRSALKRDTRAKQKKMGGRYPVAPLVEFLERHRAEAGLNLDELCASLSIDERAYLRWRSGESQNAPLEDIDRVLSATGAGWRLYALYPELDDAELGLAA